ncbi:MAG TPA: hypothetical protein VN437_01460 [Rectinemataceae bacterium]|nr:hypothetical protein [Rectinemataceae bacterium]
MSEKPVKKNETAKKAKPAEKKEDLEPCTNPHTAETARLNKGDKACDEGIK